MPEDIKGSMDDPALRGRLRQYPSEPRQSQYVSRSQPQMLSDVGDQFAPLYQSKIDQVTPVVRQPQPVQQQISQPAMQRQPITDPRPVMPQQPVYQQPAPVQVQAPAPVVAQPIQTQTPRPVQNIDEIRAITRPVAAQQILQPVSAPQPVSQPQQVYQQPAPAPMPQPRPAPVVQEQYYQAPPAPQQIEQPAPVAQQIPEQPPQQFQQQIPQEQYAPIDQLEPQASNDTVNFSDIALANQFEEKVRPEPSFTKSKKKPFILAASAVAVVGVLVGGLVLFMGYKTHQAHAENNANIGPPSSIASKAIGLPANATNKPSTGPSFTKPTSNQVADYTVANSLPRYLIIPKLNIFSMITPVGLTNSALLEAPSNIYNTGWYQASYEPGQPGAVILDGFSSANNIPGVFNGLSSLKIGDHIQVEVGSGTRFTYAVVKTQVFTSTSSMSSALQLADPTKPGMNLLTCTGVVTTCPDLLNQDYVVFTEQVN